MSDSYKTRRRLHVDIIFSAFGTASKIKFRPRKFKYVFLCRPNYSFNGKFSDSVCADLCRYFFFSFISSANNKLDCVTYHKTMQRLSRRLKITLGYCNYCWIRGYFQFSFVYMLCLLDRFDTKKAILTKNT